MKARFLGMAGGLLMSGMLAAPVLQAQPARVDAPDSKESAAAWQALMQADLAYAAEVLRRNYIYAVLKDPQWEAQMTRAMGKAQAELSRVKDFSSYRAVLEHFIAGFEDAHVSTYFNVASHQARWPGFTVVYRGGRYRVGESSNLQAPAGAAIASCDGKSIDGWLDGLTEFYGGPPGRETTRAALAGKFMVDRGNPLHALPQNCRIGDRDVALDWVSARTEDVGYAPARTSDAAETIEDPGYWSRDFGDDGAWVRIGSMYITSKAAAEQAHALIDRAAELRDKEVVVLDVRGNSGGSYDWFMAFLRAFYGPAYADYHARARLEIAHVMYVAASDAQARRAIAGTAEDPFDTPYDPMLRTVFEDMREEPLPDGGRLLFSEPRIKSAKLPRELPPNPVKARVYVLADYGCASACLSFLDEMMLFPDVTLLGSETHIDRRSGGGNSFELPSGLARVAMGQLLRDGRGRGENEAWVPGDPYRFRGDVTDTAAIERWILETVVPADQARGAWRQAARLKGPER